jgi:hypothetical protein
MFRSTTLQQGMPQVENPLGIGRGQVLLDFGPGERLSGRPVYRAVLAVGPETEAADLQRAQPFCRLP